MRSSHGLILRRNRHGNHLGYSCRVLGSIHYVRYGGRIVMEKEFQYLLNCVRNSNITMFKCIPSYQAYCIIRFKHYGYEVKSDISILTIYTGK